MKILSAKQIKEVDLKTIEYLNITSQQLMFMAQDSIFKWFTKKDIDPKTKVEIVCGIGNNGGDGVALAISLHNLGISTSIIIIEYSKNYSPDFQYYFEKAKELGISINIVSNASQIPSFKDSEIIFDAIFGTGLNREIKGLAYSAIESINQSNACIISIDVPSGLMMDMPTKFAINASKTLTLQIPKLALFLPDNNKYVGKLTILNFGLSTKAIEEATTSLFFISNSGIRNLIKPQNKFAHKGTQGHSLIIGGSIGKCGSVALASKASLKAGGGLVTAYAPKCCTIPLQTSTPELMVIEDNGQNEIIDISYSLKPNAIGIGIGMGTSEATTEAFANFISRTNTPMIIDADAINILSKNKNLLDKLQPNTILTPHPKELSRLIGEWKNDFDKLEKTQQLAKKHNIIIIIKGAHTTIVTAKDMYINSTGSPALATAGSGDVLTGIITSLLAQGYTSLQAAKIGVYLHGLTANVTHSTIHPLSFVASDIINNIGNAYFHIFNDDEIEELTNYNYKND